MLAAEKSEPPAFPERNFREKHEKTTDDHCNSDTKSEQIGKACQDIMAESFVMFVTDVTVLEQSHLQVIQISLGEWQDIPNALLGVAKKVEKKPDHHRARERIRSDIVDVAHGCHGKACTSFNHGVGPRIIDIKTRCYQKHDRESKHPVEQPEQYTPALLFFKCCHSSYLLWYEPERKVLLP
ncbi:MAG: hypothetical protein ACI8PB_001486 [Desulforhopalus sp.]